MSYYRPEEWDELHPDAIRYIEEHDMGAVLDYINNRMERVWHVRDDGIEGVPYDGDDPENFGFIAVTIFENQAFGAYNALLATCDDETIRRHIYDWGHYSVFY